MIKTAYSLCLRQFISYWHIKILKYKVISTLPLLFPATEPTPLFQPRGKGEKIIIIKRSWQAALKTKAHQYSPICQHLNYSNGKKNKRKKKKKM